MKKKLKTYPFLFTINHDQEINTTTIRERLSRKPHQLFSPHRTDFFMIYLFTEGDGVHMVDFEPFIVKPGHSLFITRGQVHSFDPKENYDGYALIFTESFFCRTDMDKLYLQDSELFSNFKRQSYFKVNNSFEKLAHLFQEIYHELSQPVDSYQGEILHNLLMRILLLSERELGFHEGMSRSPSFNQVLVRQFKKEVDENFRNHKNISFYCTKLGTGIRRLQLATAAALDKTPKEILGDRVILEAKRMLSYQNVSIKEIAFDLGFDDATNFIKYFKLRTGLTPSAFKRGEV